MMRPGALLLLLALPACAPAPPEAARPDPLSAAPVPVAHGTFGPAPQPLPEDVLASLPPGIPASDVFIAPDGCWFFLDGAQLMGLTRGDSTIPFCG
jgi:streptogramin lyase